MILSHILGNPSEFIHNPPSWQSVVENSELVVAFGGMPLRNSQISAGGTGHHRARIALSDAKQNGVNFVSISPQSSDVAEDLEAQWISARPGSDVAIMLAIAYELLRNNWHDVVFLKRYTVGYEQFFEYVNGQTDGVAKTASWAADIAQISEQTIVELAHRMAHSRTLISVSWSLTRQDHGEQPFWMATALAAMLGQIGLPGCGIAFGYCAANSIGMERRSVKYASLPQGKNSVSSFIPVARISDMLLNPGSEFQFNGETMNYPDIKLVYWAGGNSFHHHQDLTRLCEAWKKPETVIVHEWCWNALAKRADIVLPCTTQLERRDLMVTPRDPYIVAMEAVVSPQAQSRDDFTILSGVSRRMGVEDNFTEGRDTDAWLRWLYDESREMAKESGVDLPHFAEFSAKGWHYVDPKEPGSGALVSFRKDPLKSPLSTPSKGIEISSSTIASYQNHDLLPHPAWYQPKEWLGDANKQYPFHLVTGQPPEKLHSQLDHGPVSQAAKVDGRSQVSIRPQDAEFRGIVGGDLLRVYNARGACLATAVFDSAVMRGCIAISTGAWLDAVRQEDGTLLCLNGNPNTLTKDIGTSELAQGPTAHSCMVAVEKFTGNVGPSKAYVAPEFEIAPKSQGRSTKV